MSLLAFFVVYGASWNDFTPLKAILSRFFVVASQLGKSGDPASRVVNRTATDYSTTSNNSKAKELKT